MFCIRCGAEIQEGTRFCIHCGTPVAGNPVPESAEAERTKTESPEAESIHAESPEKESPRVGSLAPETPKAEVPKMEISQPEIPGPEIPETEIPAAEISGAEIPRESPRAESPVPETARPEIPAETQGRAKSPEADSIVIKIPKIKIPKVDNPAISETGEKVKELGKKYLKEGVETAQKAYQYGSEQIKSGSITIPKPKLSKKKLSMIGGIALLIVVILVVSSLLKGSGSGFRSPEEAYDAWNNGYYLHDFDLALKAWPDFDIEYQGGEDAVRAKLQGWYDDEELAEMLADYDSTYGYEAVGHTNLPESQVEELSQKMTDFYGRDIKISDIAIIERQFFSTYGGERLDVENETERETDGYAVKYKGKWYYLYLY